MTHPALARRLTLGVRVPIVILGTFGLVIACSLDDVDFENKACPCGSGWVCDDVRRVCVRPGALVTADGGGSAAGCRGDACPCAKDVECTEADRGRCSPAGVCVECLPANDNCRPGSYCNAASQCTLGCKQEADCQISPAAPHCDTARHQCVACRTVADCTGADQCSPSGECVEGCDLAQGKLCSNGKECCSGLCLDLSRDPLNCGACATACSGLNGTPTCTARVCTWACATGFAHCGTGNTGCETNTRSDALHCGSCGRDCNPLVQNADGASCVAAKCAYTACRAGFTDCNSNPEDGCDCVCGAARGQPCCPGRVCNFPGGNCTGANKCN
jgi:hypothetical protein